jgi:ATP-binding cassette, subfamily B, bacterial PglK
MHELHAVRSLFELLTRRERLWLFALAPLLALSSLAEMIGVGAIILFLSTLNRITATFVLELPFGFGQILITPQQFAVIGGAALFAIFVLKAVVIMAIHFLFMRFVFTAYRRFSTDLFRSYLRAPLIFHLNLNSTEVQRNINLQSTVLFNSVGVSLCYLTSNCLAVLVLCGGLAWLQPAAFVLATGVLTIISGVSYALLRRHLARLGARRVTHSGEAVKWVAQALGAFKEIRILGREDHFERRFWEQAHGLQLADRGLRVASNLPSLLNEITLVTGVVGLVLLYVQSRRSLPEVLPILAAFGVAGVRIMGMLASMVGHLHQIQFYAPAVQSLHAAVADLKRFRDSLPSCAVAGLPIRLRSDLTFEKVSFQYPSAESSALKNVSFSIPKATHVAVVGASGSGKSTLALVATGLLEPSAGAVLVDGVPLTADRSAWFRKIAYVPQSVFLLDSTVRANVTFEFGPQANTEKYQDAAVWEALELAQIEETIRRFPLGLDTPVGENGSALSGGERQRIGIARALYRRPEVLVMDEATSALDGATEARLMAALIHAYAGATIITVAHRASLAKMSNLVIWLDHGELVGEGSYQALFERSAAFRRMLVT